MSRSSYTALAQQQRALPAPDDGEPFRALVHAATLAASSHNTQPWSFRIGGDTITIVADRSRRCPVVDPDDSHLFKSLGCAAQNIVAAAPAYGFGAEVVVSSDGRIVIALPRSNVRADSIVLATIAERQCTRTCYDGRALAPDEMTALQAAGQGRGVHVMLIEDGAMRQAIVDYVDEGNRTQLADPAFRRELVHWIRCNDAAAIRTGDGLGVRPSGQPSLPTWLAKPLLKFVLTGKSQAEKDTRHLRSSAGIAVFVGERDDVETWVEVGRAYERFALAATARGIRNAFVNQPIEVRRLRSALHTALGLAAHETAHLIVRFGRGPLAPYSLRRPLAEVLVD